ncbi:Copper metallochaperone, bacterial analog of Cox17 protein [hydrothermal vent metagenome]|uniref:Copper metallochaperone, bacterial analog of Cox17 protein n=1 Tax=hydrothermal vent metagenome TaxID=652676 RepID=A0A3B1AQW7_9ZZZZ
MKQFYKITVLLGFFVLSADLLSADAAIKAHAPWVQDAPPTVKVHAAYMTLENTSEHSVTVAGIESPAFERVEIHKSEIHQDMVKMMHQKRLKIPAHSRIEFKPGGYHFMLMGKKHIIKHGDEVTIRLTLADGSEVVITAEVRKAMEHSKHSGHSMH